MSWDVDRGEILDAVARGDSEWIWSAIQAAYEERDSRPLVVAVDLGRVVDSDSMHDAFAEALGFPSFYGRNLDAWIDCMSYLDEPSAGMTTVHVRPGQMLVLALSGVDRFRRECGDLYASLLECAAFVNARRLESGESAVLALAF